MEFSSVEDSFEFYKDYARRLGFGAEAPSQEGWLHIPLCFCMH